MQLQIQVSEDGRWLGDFDVENNKISSIMNFQNANYLGINMKYLQMIMHSSNQALNADLILGEIIFKEEQDNDTLKLSVNDFRIHTVANNDSLQFAINWKNKYKPIKNKGDISGFVSLSQTPNIDVKLKKADLIINDTAWTIHPENQFRINENGLLFEKVGFHSGSQKIEVTGAVDQLNKQALKINFYNFNISNFDILLNSKGIDLDGVINGDMQFINLTKKVDFLADLQLNMLKINKEIIGDLSLSSKRNLDKSVFINAEIVNNLDNQIRKPLIFEGIYFPDRYENSLDFSLILNQLPVQVFTPFLYKWVDNLSGLATGNALIQGSLKQPDIKGNIRLQTVGFKIIYLNTKYNLSANVSIDNSFIDLRDADLRDEMGNKAAVYGGLFHNHLKDFGVDLSVWPQNFMGLNTRKGMNSLYYGKAFVSGTVDINGLFKEAVELDINLEASRGSEMVIPISLTADISENEFITF